MTYLSPVQSGKIDLLVHDGHYRTRAHFLRSAVEHLLANHAATLERSIARHGFRVGRITVDRDLLDHETIRILGTAVFDPALPGKVNDIRELRVYGTVIDPSGEAHRLLGDRLIRRAYAVGWEDD